MTRGLVTKGIIIKADENGNLPDEIELLHTGTWNAPYHGDWEHTQQDMREYVQHFNQGIGLVEADKQAHVNFNHERGKAGAWITELFTKEDDTRLWGKVKWTQSGRDSVLAGEYKYISPEFNPRAYPWENPEHEHEFVSNVLTAAALTNEPLHKKLKPVMATAVPPKVKGTSDKSKKGPNMNVKDLLAKKPEDLTTEEKEFLTGNRAELTPEQLKTFGLEEVKDDKKDGDKKTEDEKEAEQLRASIKAGTHVVIEASAYRSLEKKVEASAKVIESYEREKVDRTIAAHVSRGAIKSDDAKGWADKVMADRSLETMLASLPDNQTINAGAAGDGGDSAANAASQVNIEVNALMASAKLSYKDALAQVRAEKPQLYADYQSEMSKGE
ncbi:phage protease [Nocardia sp. NPDC055165]